MMIISHLSFLHSLFLLALSEMVDHDDWLGYLVSVFIKETITHAKECCPGCHSQKSSALLHSHHQSGLLEKLFMFHPIVKGTMLTKLPALITDFIEKFPDPEIYDDAGQKVLRTFGRDFLMQTNPTFIYYSQYLTPERDEVIGSSPAIHVNPMTLKRAATKMSKKTQPCKKRPKKLELELYNTI